MNAILQTRNLSASIENAGVLRNVDFHIDAGETVAIIGRNGAGKTSLLRAIMGTLPATQGAISFRGQSIDALAPHARARLGIGYAPEERRLIGSLTVLENLMIPAWACRLDAATIKRRMDLIHTVAPELPGIGARLGGLISGGQQKIVALGRALMAGENLILLDEPFQGLAPALALRYADSIRTLRRERPDLAVIVTESNPKLLESMADRTVLMERGVIESVAPAVRAAA